MGFDLVRQPLLWYNRLNEVVYLNFRRVVRMSSKVSKGIALLLFGILLCAGSGEINTTILYNFGDDSDWCVYTDYGIGTVADECV